MQKNTISQKCTNIFALNFARLFSMSTSPAFHAVFT